MPAVYILRCADDSFYVGSTNHLEFRLEQHSRGGAARYTSLRLPVSLVWSQDYDRVDEAWAVERKLHGWSRAKKQALIDGRFELLPKLASRPSARGK